MKEMKDERKTTHVGISNSFYQVSFRDDVAVEQPTKEHIAVFRNGVKFLETAASPLLEALIAGWITESSIDELAGASGNLALVYYMGEKLFSSGLLQGQYRHDGKAVFTLIPTPHWETWQKNAPVSLQRLSSHACLRLSGDRFMIEMPLSKNICIIEDAQCLGWLMEITGKGLVLPVENRAQMAFYQALFYMGALTDGRPDSDLWEFHDLLFFHETSIGFHDDPVGATCRLKDAVPPAPLFKHCAGEVLPLPVPDTELSEKLHRPFAEVLEKRRTGRVPGKKPVTLEEIGALLHQAARVQEIREEPGQPSEVSRRPSPSGGALHSLEIYLLVRECSGLVAGAWRYDPAEHRLEAVDADKAMVGAYEKENPHPQIADALPPHVRIVITSRFLREAWKYEKIAYRLILQDLGCLYQTLSLTASALGLSSCIIGAVEAKRLGMILKIESLVEPVIGEMLLSSQN